MHSAHGSPGKHGGSSYHPPLPKNMRTAGFTSSDATWLERFGTHMANAVLYAQGKEVSRLRTHTARLADARSAAIMEVTRFTAHEIGKTASDASVSDAILFARVVALITDLLNCDRATMWLASSATERPQLHTMVQPFPPVDGAPLIRLKVPMKEGSIIGSCVVHSQVINIKG